MAFGSLDEHTVGVGCPDVLTLCATVIATLGAAVYTGRVESLSTELAETAADTERRQDPVARLNRLYCLIYLFNAPHRLVAHPGLNFAVTFSTIKPEVGATDCYICDSNDCTDYNGMSVLRKILVT